MEEYSLNYIQHLCSLFSVPPLSRNQIQLEEIMQFTKNNKFLRKICEEHNSDRIHWECSRFLSLEIYEKNSTIFNFGEIGDRFYIILKGTVGVIVPTKSIKRSNSTKQDILKGLKRMQTGSQEDLSTCLEPETNDKLSTLIKGLKRQQSQLDFDYLTNFGIVEESKEVRLLTSGDCFGELALINNKPRTATIEAKTLSYLAVLSKKDFTKILSSHTYRALDERVDYLKLLPGFNSVTKLSLQKLAYTFTEKTYKKDQIIYNKNDPVTTLFFIKSGEFKLSQCDILSTSKYSSSDISVKLSMMKKNNKKVNLREVIKTINEVFGYEEIVENKLKRERNCICISQLGQVYEVRVDDIKRFPLFNDIQGFFEEKYKSDHIRVSLKNNPVKEIDKFRLGLNSYRVEKTEKIQEILYEMRNKDEKKEGKFKLESFKGQSWTNLSSPIQNLNVISVAEDVEVSKPYKQKNKLSLQFISNALGNTEEKQPKAFHRRGLRKSTLESVSVRDHLKKFKHMV